jgi:hypothetical protein
MFANRPWRRLSASEFWNKPLLFVPCRSVQWQGMLPLDLPTRLSGKEGSLVRKLLALLTVCGFMALGCGPAPTTKTTPPATTTPAPAAGSKAKAPEEKKGEDKKGDEKGHD